ncbi:MAG: hypothetical protein DHS20C20_25170 [Ardenticatenaceae bacterium]|nr:MAG: hypothetical protein DHS20C20_25170 [Ardenticatenaceae bacterium]
MENNRQIIKAEELFYSFMNDFSGLLSTGVGWATLFRDSIPCTHEEQKEYSKNISRVFEKMLVLREDYLDKLDEE